MPSGGALAAHAQCATLVPTGQVSSGFHGNTSCLLSVFDEINKVCDLKRALVIHWFIGSSGLTRRVHQMTANMAATNVVLDNNKKFIKGKNESVSCSLYPHLHCEAWWCRHHAAGMKECVNSVLNTDLYWFNINGTLHYKGNITFYIEIYMNIDIFVNFYFGLNESLK